MAINRTMMKRQLYEDGGLGLVPREQYGLGSFLKKTFRKVTKPFVKVAQKLVPKEIAKPLMVAAPFLGPYAPLIYAAGSAKATGRIDPVKLALTAAPYVKFEGIKPVGYGGSKYGIFGGDEIGFGKKVGLPEGTGVGEDLRGTSIADRVDKGASKQFEALAKGEGKTASIKEVGAEILTDPKTIVSGGVSLATYIDEQKKLKEDQGLEFTEEDYNNAVNEFYSKYSESFERGFGQTGGIAQTRKNFALGGDDDELPEDPTKPVNPFQPKPIGPVLPDKMAESRPSQLFKLLEEAEAAGDDDKVKEIKSDLFREFGIKLAKGGRVKLEDGTTITPMKKPEQTEENTIIPMDTFESKINNAVMGIRGGIDKDLMVEMLENQRVELGIPEDDAKMAVQNFMLRFRRGIK
tara:strand:+ start:7295 stop:8512 length:1218 start_codon:yes stop_codon:yes gene_type:complete